MKFIDFRPYILLVFSVISAILYIYISKQLSFIIIIATFFFIFKLRYATIISIIYLFIIFISSHLYIITGIERVDEGGLRLFTPSATIITDMTNKDINVGALLFSNFQRVEKQFSKKNELELKDSNSYYILTSKILTSILNFRRSVSERFFYQSGGKITITQALIFGDKRFIDNDTRELYTVTGLAHLLAMSGLHVGLILLFIIFLIPNSYKSVRYLMTICLTILLIILGGFSITVIRASIMAILYIALKVAQVDFTPKTFIFFVFSIFIMLSPESIKSISFLLSFGAVFGIALLVGRKKGGFIYTSIYVGMAATLITAPLSLYYFNTTNHLSIFSTIVMIPIIQLQIILGFLGTIFTDITLPSLIFIESFAKVLLITINSYTYFAFTLKAIPLHILILTVLFILVTLLTRYKFLALLSLLIIFYPAEKPNEFIFPNFKGATKGFLAYENGRGKIIYFTGTTSQFKYQFIPIIAKYGENIFEEGYVNLIDSRKASRYIKIINETKEYDSVCLNYIYNDCKIIYHTRSNSIKSEPEDSNIHVIYKNNLTAKNIYIIDEVGSVLIDKGEVSFDKDFSK